MRQDIAFNSAGSKITGHLYMPETAKPVPGIVLCHGFAGVKELLLPAFAERFSEAGFAALTFDYRGFGESEGERGRLVPSLQIEDIKNAISFMSQCPDIDSQRIGLWGTSFGGANAICVAAEDSRVRALVVQLTFGDGERVITGKMSPDEKQKFFELIEKMQERKKTSGKEMMVNISKVLSDPQSQAFYEIAVKEFPALAIKIPFLTVAETIGHKPERLLDKVHIPILIVAASRDGVNPPNESQLLFDPASEPKSLVLIDGATHYDVYKGAYFEQAIAKQLEWFCSHLFG